MEKLHNNGQPEKPARWKRLRIIAGGALIAATFATTFTVLCDRESGRLGLYKKGKISIEELSFEDKIEAWKFDLRQGDKCRPRYNKVMDEIQEEQFRLMRLGDNSGMRTLSRIRETFISTQLVIKNKFKECEKNAGK